MAYTVIQDLNSWGPATDAVSVTKSDSTVYTPALRALLITGSAGGDVAVVTAAGTTITITVTGGFLLPLAVTKVLSTGTTATGIIGLR